MRKIKLNILGITPSQTQSGAYTLTLVDADGDLQLPIIIGGAEAQSIAIELEKMKPTRPLTHDLFKSVSNAFGISVTEVYIYKFVEGVFFAKLVCKNETQTEEIDSRTSDAVAIAVRFNCPIYTDEKVIEDLGYNPSKENESNSSVDLKSEDDFDDTTISSLTADELNQLLMNAIDEEAYEKASRIRDEINKRKKDK